MAEVSVVIVCMNRPDILFPCLDSIREHTSVSHEVWVVAYLFSPENLEKLKAAYPYIHIVESTELRGFSENNNLALRQIQSPYCFILNDDTLMSEPVIDRLWADLRSLPVNAAAISPCIRFADGRIQTCGRTRWTPLRYARHYLHLVDEGKMGEGVCSRIASASLRPLPPSLTAGPSRSGRDTLSPISSPEGDIFPIGAGRGWPEIREHTSSPVMPGHDTVMPGSDQVHGSDIVMPCSDQVHGSGNAMPGTDPVHGSGNAMPGSDIVMPCSDRASHVIPSATPVIPSEASVSRTYTLNGACFLIKTEVFKKLGWFDERYFFTPEDIALGHALNDAGYTVWVNPEVSITHLAGGSVSAMEQAIKPARVRGSMIFYGEPLWLKCFVWCFEALRAMSYLVRPRTPRNAVMRQTARNVMASVFSNLSPKELFIKFRP